MAPRFDELVMEAGSFRNYFKSIKKRGKSVERELERHFAEQNGLFKLIGFKVDKVKDGSVRMSFRFSQYASGRNGEPRVHGGVIAYALDTAGTIAVMTQNDSVEQATLELKTNFLRPLVNDPFTVRAKVIRSGRAVSVSEGEVLDSNGRVCARSLGTWFIPSVTESTSEG